MHDMSLIQIGPLDQRVRVDSDLLRVFHKIQQKSIHSEQVEGATDDLLQRYLAVIRKRAGLHRRHDYFKCVLVERQALHMLTTSSPIDPAIREMQRALDDLDSHKYDGPARRILQEAIDQREKLISEAQQIRATGRHKLKPLDRRIVRILKRDMQKTWRDIFDELERSIGDGVIKDIDDESIWTVSEVKLRDSEEVKISSLPSIVSRLRARIRGGEL
mgnify:CR=1 FL=1